MESLARELPPGCDTRSFYGSPLPPPLSPQPFPHPDKFVGQIVRKVIVTIFVAVLMSSWGRFLFLQRWRAYDIPSHRDTGVAYNGRFHFSYALGIS